MSRTELVRRYSFFTLSVLVNAFSIAVITKALLGTSPISSLPLVLSYITPGTIGQFTIYLNFLFILLDLTMMTRTEIRQKWTELVAQIPITLLFGFSIDLGMACLAWLEPSYYLARVFTLLVGCFLLGAGVSMEVKANVAMVTGEYLVQVISKFVRRDFGLVKVCFDVSLVIIASALSFIFLHGLEGVREGTVVAALLVGPISHIVLPWWRFLDAWLFVTKAKEKARAEGIPMEYPLVVTITREVGAGGRVLGRMVAGELGIKYYDRELIAMVAKDSHLPEQYITDNEQKANSNYLMHIILQGYGAPMTQSISPRDALFVSQSRVIRQLATEEPCVIIGRCSDYILKDFPKKSVIRVFCYTNKDDAIRRCREEYGMPEERLTETVVESNRSRISHYQYYTGRNWGDPHYYDLTINTGVVPMQTAAALITKLYRDRASGVLAPALS